MLLWIKKKKKTVHLGVIVFFWRVGGFFDFDRLIFLFYKVLCEIFHTESDSAFFF